MLMSACTMNTNEIKQIKHHFDVDIIAAKEVHIAYWKPQEMMDYSYAIGTITTTEEEYERVIIQLEAKYKVTSPAFKMNWKVPNEVVEPWWNPSEKTIANTRFIKLKNGWIQTKYEGGKIYVLKTIN